MRASANLGPRSAGTEIRLLRPRVAVIASSSVANLLRSVASSLLTIVLPLFLVLTLPSSSYSAWVLMFGMATYVIYLDLGLQPVVQSMVGRLDGLQDHHGGYQVVRSAMKLMGFVAAVCIPLSGLAAYFVGTLFPGIPATLVPDFQVALVITVCGQLCILISNVAMAYYAGRQTLLRPSAVIGVSRLLALLLAGSSAIFTSSLTWVATALTVPLALGMGILLLGLRREYRALGPISQRLSLRKDGKRGAKYLLRYSGALILWNLCMIVVNGAGVVVVAKLDYVSLGAYGVASMFVALVLGLENAFVGPLLSELGRRRATGGSYQDDLRMSMRVNGIFLGLVSVSIFVMFPVLREFFPEHIRETLLFAYVFVLLISNQVRLSMTPLSMLYIALQRHGRIVFPPLAEAAVSVSAALLLGHWFGLMGVVTGSLLGSATGVALALTWSASLAKVDLPGRLALVSDSIAMPVLCLLPSLTTACLLGFGVIQASTAVAVSMSGVCALASCVLVWTIGLKAKERQLIAELVAHVLPAAKRWTSLASRSPRRIP